MPVTLTPLRKPPKRSAGTDREGMEQATFFTWLQYNYPYAWDYAFHPANGGHRHKATAGKLKSQGVRAGVPDIFLDLPRGAYHGLRIELKATPPHDAALAASQREWLARLTAAGYCARLCKGFDAAKRMTEAYLALGVFDGVSCLAD